MSPCIIFFFTVLGFLVHYGSSLSQTDREVLRSLYDTTGGYPWMGWNFSSTLNATCNWKGILCDANNNIVELQLQSSEYQGTIPTIIGRLTSLSKVYLSENKVTGSYYTYK